MGRPSLFICGSVGRSFGVISFLIHGLSKVSFWDNGSVHVYMDFVDFWSSASLVWISRLALARCSSKNMLGCPVPLGLDPGGLDPGGFDPRGLHPGGFQACGLRLGGLVLIGVIAGWVLVGLESA